MTIRYLDVHADVHEHKAEYTPSMAKGMSLAILTVAAISSCGEEAVAQNISTAIRQSAQLALICESSSPSMTLPTAGKLQKDYFEKIASITFPLLEDERFLRASKLSSIRYDPRLFYPKQDQESPEEQMASLKDETARRLRVYTSERDGWFVLDLKKMGFDKKSRLPHEFNIQLGDLLVDIDIRMVLIQRADGTTVSATRGICAEGGYKGRIGFLDDKKQFVPVFSGDRFRILSDGESLSGQNVERLKHEHQSRAEHKKSYQTQRGSAATFSGKEDALRAARKITYDPNDVKIPTIQMVADANKECRRDSAGNAVKNYYLALGKENFMEIVKYCAAEVGVPVELMLTTMKKESGFLLAAVGDHGKAVGLGQLHEPIWKFVRSKPKFSEIMSKFTDRQIGAMRRGESVLEDVLSIALLLKSDLNANAIDATYTTRLTPRQIMNVRFHYHVPGIFRSRNREKGFNRWKAGYSRYAEEVLKVRQILDEVAGTPTPVT